MGLACAALRAIALWNSSSDEGDNRIGIDEQGNSSWFRLEEEGEEKEEEDFTGVTTSIDDEDARFGEEKADEDRGGGDDEFKSITGEWKSALRSSDIELSFKNSLLLLFE